MRDLLHIRFRFRRRRHRPRELSLVGETLLQQPSFEHRHLEAGLFSSEPVPLQLQLLRQLQAQLDLGRLLEQLPLKLIDDSSVVGEFCLKLLFPALLLFKPGKKFNVSMTNELI